MTGTPSPIYSLPFFNIEQMRAVAAVLRAHIDASAPDTNEGQDWTPPDDLAGVAAAVAHLDEAIKMHNRKPMGPPGICPACNGSGSLAGEGGPAGDCDFCGGQGWR